jgi:hypothetical protein
MGRVGEILDDDAVRPIEVLYPPYELGAEIEVT